MDVIGFIKQRVDLFKDFTTERIRELVDDSLVRSLRLTKRSLIRAQSKYTQVEIAMTEQFKLGIHPPIRESGDIADTPGCVLESSNGSVQLDKGVICALRHVHMTPEDALRYGVRDKSFVRVRITG